LNEQAGSVRPGLLRERRPGRTIAGPSSAPGLPGEPFDLDVPAAVVDLCAEFRSEGHMLVLVGGSVRDLLMGRTPSSDWDMATSATVYQVSRICRGAVFEDSRYTEFTLAFATHEGLKLEITPFRDRHDYQWTRGPNLDPQQPPGTLAQDLLGRDFTINAIAHDPLDEVLFDPLDGHGDLRRRVLCALPDAEARFRFDPVRILRGIRISVKLGFEIAPETQAAMGAGLDGARHDARRTLMELVRLLCGPTPSRSLALLRAGAIWHGSVPRSRKSQRNATRGFRTRPCSLGCRRFWTACRQRLPSRP
jgi:tRNA nucleotidyltransferase/poly(A) polymerase